MVEFLGQASPTLTSCLASFFLTNYLTTSRTPSTCAKGTANSLRGRIWRKSWRSLSCCSRVFRSWLTVRTERTPSRESDRRRTCSSWPSPSFLIRTVISSPRHSDASSSRGLGAKLPLCIFANGRCNIVSAFDKTATESFLQGVSTDHFHLQLADHFARSTISSGIGLAFGLGLRRWWLAAVVGLVALNLGGASHGWRRFLSGFDRSFFRAHRCDLNSRRSSIHSRRRCKFLSEPSLGSWKPTAVLLHGCAR